jgi:predicted phage tail protein
MVVDRAGLTFAAVAGEKPVIEGGTDVIRIDETRDVTLRGLTVTGASVSLAWRASAASIVSSYRLIIGATSGGRELGVADVGPVTTFTAAAPTGAYFLRVFAVNACGMGAPSAETVVVVGNPVVPPVAPYGLAVTKAAGTLTFTWAAPSIGTPPFSYRLEAGSAPGLANLATVPVGTTSFSAAGVPPGLYYIRVRAIGAGGVGPVSNELVVAVP